MKNDPELRCDTADIVYEKPPSGAFEEVLFGSDRGNTLWVKFSDQHGLGEWIGKFGCGWASPMRVTKVVQPDTFVVVAGGFAYVLNATTRQLLNHHQGDYTEDVVYDSETSQFIVGDTDLRIIADGREVWRSTRLALDGIHELVIKDRILTGMAVVGDEGESEPFILDLNTRQFIKHFELFSQKHHPPLPPTPWWQFWK